MKYYFLILLIFLLLIILFKPPVIKNRRVVITLTTSPQRIKDIKPVIDCLSSQTFKPDTIYLNLPRIFKRDKTKFDKIPDFITENPLITINFCNDLGPATKILGSIPLEKDPETIFLSVDDDIYYPPQMLETYIYWSNKFPEAVLTGTTFMFLEDDQRYYPLRKCELLEGFSGVLYKQKFLKDFDPRLYRDCPLECYLADDFVLSNFISKKNIPILALTRNQKTISQLKPLDYGLNGGYGLHEGAGGLAFGNRRNYEICSRYFYSKKDLYISYYLNYQENKLSDV